MALQATLYMAIAIPNFARASSMQSAAICCFPCQAKNSPVGQWPHRHTVECDVACLDPLNWLLAVGIGTVVQAIIHQVELHER